MSFTISTKKNQSRQIDIDVFRLIFFLLILLLLWVQFFIPELPSSLAKLIFLCSVIFGIFDLFMRGGLYLSERLKRYALCIISFLIIDIYFNGLSITYSLNHFIVVAIMLFLLNRDNIVLPHIEFSIINSVFYYTFLLGILMGIAFFHDGFTI